MLIVCQVPVRKNRGRIYVYILIFKEIYWIDRFDLGDR